MKFHSALGNEQIPDRHLTDKGRNLQSRVENRKRGNKDREHGKGTEAGRTGRCETESK